MWALVGTLSETRAGGRRDGERTKSERVRGLRGWRSGGSIHEWHASAQYCIQRRVERNRAGKPERTIGSELLHAAFNRLETASCFFGIVTIHNNVDGEFWMAAMHGFG